MKTLHSKTTNRLITIFAHFNRNNEVTLSDLYYLEEIKKISEKIIFVSTSKLDDEQRKKLSTTCALVLTRPNQGLDFCSYKLGLQYVELNDNQNLLLANDSVYGPIFALSNIYQKFLDNPAEAYGQTISYEHKKHLQSYFMLFKPKAHQHPSFLNFWKNIQSLDNKKLIIQQYEIGLSNTLEKACIKIDALHNQPYSKLRQLFCILQTTQFQHKSHALFIHLKKLMNKKDLNFNPTHYLAEQLHTKYQAPLVKKELLDKNPKNINLKTLKSPNLRNY